MKSCGHVSLSEVGFVAKEFTKLNCTRNQRLRRDLKAVERLNPACLLGHQFAFIF